jgi:hypothetical protein
MSLCNADDGCGGMCTCPNGQVCVDHACSTNGCLLGIGEYCGINPEGGASDCCASGYKCPVVAAEAGVATCCAITNDGECESDSDCCDAPAVKCTAILSDAGVTIGRICM